MVSHESANASSTAVNKSSNSEQTKYFTISEWGVRAQYSGNLTLTYVVNGPNSVALSSSQLAADGPEGCTETLDAEAGELMRYLPNDSNLGPKIPTSETAEQYVTQNPTVPHVKLGNYIYIYGGKSYLSNGTYTGPCNDKAAALQTIAAYSALVPKLQTIPQTFFTCVAEKGVLAKQGPAACSIGGTNYTFPSSFTTDDIVNYDKVPSRAQSLVSSLARKNFNGCLQLATTGKPYTTYPYLTVNIAASNFVSVGVNNCDNGYMEDFGLQGDTWNDLGSRQVDLSCAYVSKYDITQSEVIAGNTEYTKCMNANAVEQPIPQ